MIRPAFNSAASAGLCTCHLCGLRVRVPAALPSRSSALCPRCGAAVHKRKPDSLGRIWALLITAALLYIPSMALPVMLVEQMGTKIPTKVLTGVSELIAQGMWPLAIIVFCASIVIPMLKIITLAFLLITTQLGVKWRPRQRTKIFRAVEFIGRWSMLDIFMISILAALVRLGFFATFTPAAGAVFFASVVILTMLASASFDPRLIWDNKKD